MKTILTTHNDVNFKFLVRGTFDRCQEKLSFCNILKQKSTNITKTDKAPIKSNCVVGSIVIGKRLVEFLICIMKLSLLINWLSCKMIFSVTDIKHN